MSITFSLYDSERPIPQSFEYILEAGSPVFLYRVCGGQARRSLAHAVAAGSGVGPGVVARATELMDKYMVRLEAFHWKEGWKNGGTTSPNIGRNGL